MSNLRESYVRVGVTVPRVALASPLDNVAVYVALINRAATDGVQFLLFPELGLTGYSCGDLFLNRALQQGALDALAAILKQTRALPIVFAVGLPLSVNNALYNVAAICAAGHVWALVPKSYLPNYAEFYEARWFSPARNAIDNRVKMFGIYSVQFGADIIVNVAEWPDFCLGTEICEDIWVPQPPSTFYAAAGATILANLSASNITIGKAEYRRELVVGASGRFISAYLYCAAGPGESTSDLSWDGHAIIAERGAVLAESERFVQNGNTLITADVDVATLVRERQRQTSFADNAADILRGRTIRSTTITLNM